MLLCYLTPSQYFNATTPLCKSLILLANKKRSAEEPNFIINFNAPGEYHISNIVRTMHYAFYTHTHVHVIKYVHINPIMMSSMTAATDIFKHTGLFHWLSYPVPVKLGHRINTHSGSRDAHSSGQVPFFCLLFSTS